MARIYIMNTTIVPNNGTYKLEDLGVVGAQHLIDGYSFTSAIGHASTAEIISSLLGIEIPMNRATISFEPGDIAICFKLDKRPPEGEILSTEQLKELGYSFKLLKRID